MRAILGAMLLYWRKSMLIVSGLLLCSGSMLAQKPKPAGEISQQPVWVMQNSGTTAGLRGIYSVDGKIAWASGSDGTVQISLPRLLPLKVNPL